jgi:hypothetical protein
MDGDFIVCSHQVDLGEAGTPEDLVRVADMINGVAIVDGPDVQCSVAAAGTPPVVLFGYDV